MILVTGVNGFVGRHLVRELKNQGYSVMGISNTKPIADPEISSLLDSYTQCDITQEDQVKQLNLSSVQSVINLAGLAKVGPSFDNPELYMKVNVDVLSVLANKIYKQNPHARILAISTGAIYSPKQSMPIDEQGKLIENGSPYVLSKLAMEQEALRFRQAGFDCIVARPFNHIGPNQGLGFLIPDMIKKIHDSHNSDRKLRVGNINTIRDYTDVRDIVKAYIMIATQKNLTSNLYNVCSGLGISGLEIIKNLCSTLGIDYDELELVTDQSLIRPNDPEKIIGDNSLLSKDTGWQPTITIKKTVEDIINHQPQE